MRALHSDGNSNFVFPEWHENVEVTHVSSYKKIKNESLVGLNVDVSLEGVKKSVFLIGNIGIKGKPEFLTFDGMELMISYGSIDKKIPFELALKDFEMERYPGTNSAASYASDVVLI